jgi:hypothetical protein
MKPTRMLSSSFCARIPGLPSCISFLTRPQLLTRRLPLPTGRDIPRLSPLLGTRHRRLRWWAAIIQLHR